MDVNLNFKSKYFWSELAAKCGFRPCTVSGQKWNTEWPCNLVHLSGKADQIDHH